MQEMPQPPVPPKLPVTEVEEPEPEIEKTKDDIIVEQCKASGEPYIVIRAKDNLAYGAFQFYLFRVVEEKCPEDFVENLKTRFDEFTKWREVNRWRTRLPD